MSQREAATRGRRSRRAAARPESRVKRTVVALGTVMLVITPISWILLHQPQSDRADASVPYVTRDDDTYLVDSDNQPVIATPTVPEDGESPTPTPGKTPGTPKPTAVPTTPGQRPTSTPTTAKPTDGPGTTSTPSNPTPSNDPDATGSPSNTPSSTPTNTPPPPPADDGSMDGQEEELFAMVDNERTEQGCSSLRPNSSLSNGAQADASTRAANGDVSDRDSSMAAEGGDGVDTAKEAFDRLMSKYSSTILNCGLDEVGVGHDQAKYCTTKLLGACLGTSERDSWVVDFK